MISASQTGRLLSRRQNEPVLGSSTTRRGRAHIAIRQSSIFLAIALVLAPACAPAGTPGTTGSPGASPSAGGAASSLVIDRDMSDLISLDPAVLYELSAVFATHNVYETLVKFEGTDLTTPNASLATSCE